ncbi:DNA-binding protein [Archangium sp.]|uniref:DNA-binding protein n=1 Tax=Archangium sp. TaxID=1872627 RepID=UPI002D4235E4|nr:DNA-binding protein [Archangium sp.]HYO56103.1 DNA-binding protein [Archangium sp.]
MPRRSNLVLLCVLAVAGTGCGDNEPQQPQFPPISQVRASADGVTETIEGFVTVQPGAFVSALGDEGFALQDSSGSGIYVKVTQKLDFGLGAKVRVTGTLANQNKLRILESEPASVQKLEGTQQVSPKVVGTGTVNESVEGSLIKVSGNITQTFQDDSPYGYKLYINDGSGELQVFVHVSAGFSKDALTSLVAGQRITVTGLAAQYEDIYEVAPRQPSDLTTN